MLRRNEFRVRDHTKVAESPLLHDLNLNIFYCLAFRGKPLYLASKSVKVFDSSNRIAYIRALHALRTFNGITDNHEGIMGRRTYHIRLNLGKDIEAVKKNLVRLLASTKMLELNICDLKELL